MNMNDKIAAIGTPHASKRQNPDRDRLLRMSEVEEITGLSKRMIYRLISQGRFPQQYKPGGWSSRWSESEIVAWRESQRS